jgi:drug/metabolite transporter (DMT)-like permease
MWPRALPSTTGPTWPRPVVFRSAVTALVIVAILAAQGVRVAFTARHKRMLPLIGLLIGVQSLCLYSAVARLPVALALLAFNTYPIWTALWSWVVYRQRPERAMLIAMPVILAGLALALDVLGAASGLGAAGQWGRIGAGVGVCAGGRRHLRPGAGADPA